jgi:DNA-binding NarL/FixJ family response regulator
VLAVPFWNAEGVVLGGVLVVDDNQSFADGACVLLERQGERVLGTACTSAEAMQLAAELRPDVVLVDMMLGDESGLDLAQLLAANGSCHAPVVILISSYSPSDVTELIAASPAAGFMPKSDLSSDAIRQVVMGSGEDSACGNGPQHLLSPFLLAGRSGSR